MHRGSSSGISARRGVQLKRKTAGRPGRKGPQVRLMGRQRAQLKRWARKTRDPELRRRVQIVLLRHWRWDYRSIAESQNCGISTVSRTLSRWSVFGEAGLMDQRIDNGNRKVDEDYLGCLADVLEDTANDHGWPRPTWTREMLIQTVGRKTRTWISRATMSRALGGIGARRGRPKPIVLCPWSKHRRTRRLNQIRALQDNHPPGEIVLHADEVDIHLNPKIGSDWMLPGQQRLVVTPGQNKKRYLAGAWDVQRRHMTYVESDRKRSLLFIDLCLRLLEVYADKRKIHLIVDNYVIHKSKITQRALADMGGRIVLHFLPPYCPDANKIEIRWKHLHDNVTRNHRYKTLNGLMGSVRRYLDQFKKPIKMARVVRKRKQVA